MRCFPLSRHVLALVALLALWLGLLPAEAAAQDRPALGLIVKMKDAVSYEKAAALATGGSTDRERERLQRVLGKARMAPLAVRPTGRAAQHLDFGRLLPPDEAQRLAAELRADPDVEWVVPNERERLLQVAAPNDPWFDSQWWLQPVSGSNQNVLADRRRGVPGIRTAWSQRTGSPGIVVAVLDTGITAHEDLVGRTVQGYDFVKEIAHANDSDGRDDNPADPGDWVTPEEAATKTFEGCDVQISSSWHGTVIAGIVAAQTDNDMGVAGIDRSNRILPVRVSGKCGAAVADIVDGMRWAAGLPVANVPPNANKARVVNISFGGDPSCNVNDPNPNKAATARLYTETIRELAAEGVVVVAAAGNENGAVTRPATCAGAVAVAALNRDGFKSTYSNFGPQVAVSTVGGDPVDHGAWGARLGDNGLVTLGNAGYQGPAGGDYRQVFGTSFSAPLASGVVSLMLGVNPGLTVPQIIDGLRASARPHVTSPSISACSSLNPGRCICSTATCGAGILDAEQALRFASDPAGYLAPNWPAVVIDNGDVDAAVALGPDQPSNSVPVASSGGGSADGGGGAIGLLWLAGLALAVLAVARTRP